MSVSESIATEADIINCYRVILGREPEGLDVIRNTLAERPTTWTLIRNFLKCDEALNRQLLMVCDRIGTGRYANHVELEGSDAQMEMLLRHVHEVWAKFGDDEPFWSVLTGEEFRRDVMNATSEEVFYNTGRESCDLFTDACVRNGLKQPTNQSIVDFGCGVGRLGEHLSRDFARYIGVDISRPHLELARKRLLQIGRNNCEFVLLPDFLGSDLRYSAFMSLIVLQHNPPPVMRQVLKALLERLKPGGVGYFQLPCILFGYEFRLAKYLEMVAENKEMEMHALPQRVVFDLISEQDCRLVEVTLDGLIGGIGHSYTFLVEKL